MHAADALATASTPARLQPCSLLSLDDKFADLTRSLSDHWLVNLLLIQVVPWFANKAHFLAKPVVAQLQSALEDKKQASVLPLLTLPWPPLLTPPSASPPHPWPPLLTLPWSPLLALPWLDAEPQAQKFKSNEFDSSNLNISLNMLRKVGEGRTDTSAAGPVRKSCPSRDGDGIASPASTIGAAAATAERFLLTYSTLIEEPLEHVIRDKHVRDKVVAAAKLTNDKYAFLHTLAHEDHYKKMMGFVINRISMAFNHEQLAYEADEEGRGVTLRRFWFGICSEAPPEETSEKVMFSRKLRIFMASEQLLENICFSHMNFERKRTVRNLREDARRMVDRRVRSGSSRSEGGASTREEEPDAIAALPSIPGTSPPVGRAATEPTEPPMLSHSPSAIRTPADAFRKQEDPFISHFDKFYEAKKRFLERCETDPQLRGKMVDDARADPACESLERVLGFMPHQFLGGTRTTPMYGLKRWQSLVEMAYIYADGTKEAERGGGLLMPVDLPVRRDAVSSALNEAATALPAALGASLVDPPQMRLEHMLE